MCFLYKSTVHDSITKGTAQELTLAYSVESLMELTVYHDGAENQNDCMGMLVK